MREVAPEGGFRTNEEDEVFRLLGQAFSSSEEGLETKLDNFPKYIRRQRLTRLLSLYEIFKRIMPVKGSIIECGVYHGFGLMSWAQISAVLEPANLTRRIYGFDTFEGFPDATEKDVSALMKPERGQLSSNSHEELLQLIELYDRNRFLGHVNKVSLVKGDVVETIPQFVKENKHLLVSMLFLDMDLYEPTKVALEHFVPRMSKGAVIAFDELDNPLWPGETLAMLEYFRGSSLRLERVEFDPYISYAILE